MEKAIARGLELGSTFVDVRFERFTVDSVGAEDGKPKESGSSTRLGIGVRALAGGSWGFSAVQLPEPIELGKILTVAEEAAKLAKASRTHSKAIELAEVKSVKDKVQAEFSIDPRNVSVEERMDVCVEASRRMLQFDSAIKKSYAGISTSSVEKLFSSSEGTELEQSDVVVHGGLFATAVSGGNSEFYMQREAGTRGFELINDYNIVSHAEEVAKKALTLVKAKGAPTKKLPVILDPEFVALLIHEIVGHPSEADRVIGKEAAWAGRAWWADKVGQKLFSDQLTVVSDATQPGHLGSFKYDDEGVPTKRITHIQKGVLQNFLHSRETAKIFNTEPNGGMRATSYLFVPLIRMTNTYAEKGEWTFDDMLEGIKEGVYLRGEKVPSIDSRRYNFQISAKEASLIENGEITQPLRSATLTGTSPDFLSSIDAVARDAKIFPIPNCGKGDPMQTMRVGNGGPHIRGFGMVTGPK